MMMEHIQAALGQEHSELHRRLLDFGRRRVDVGYRHWSQRHPRWRESEQLYRAFQPADEEDQKRSDKPLTRGVTKIVVPYGYAVIQSVLAFFLQVFTSRKPVIPVEGEGPADVRAAYLMEVLLDRQMHRMRPAGVLVWYQWWLDGFRYGVGVVKRLWTVREYPKMVRDVSPIVDPFTGQSMGYREQYTRKDVTAYEGNTLINVLPFHFLPDPNRPFSEFQQGEFCVHRLRRSWTEMRQKQAQGLYAGIRWIPRRGTGAAWGGDGGMDTWTDSDASRVAEMAPFGDEADSGSEPYVYVDELYAFVDPGLLGLDGDGGGGGNLAGASESGGVAGVETEQGFRYAPAEGTPELWVFTLANGGRIVRAEPVDSPSHDFPFDVIEPNYDVHSPSNFGLIETFRGPAYILSWLFNSRMLNVGKTLNNEYVVDPSLIEEIDLLDSDPGRLIRLKQEAWNSGKIREAVYPLPVVDVTATHHQDSDVVIDLIQQISGVSNNIMGLPNTGRRSATETQGVMQMAAGRMKMLVEIASHQGHRPQAEGMAMNTQAYAGELGLRLRPPYDRLLGAPFVNVSPEMLQGEFSFPFTEQGMPTDRLFEANVWKELLMMGMQAGGGALAASPQFAPVLIRALFAIFGRFLHAMGVKDLQTFGLSLPELSMMPDDVLQEQVRQGNLTAAPSPEVTPHDGFPLPNAAGTPNVGANGMGSAAGTPT